MKELLKKLLIKLLDKLKLLGIALVVMGAIVGIAWYFATADIREIEREHKADPVYQKAMAEIKEKEKAEKEKQEKLNQIDEKKQAEEKEIADFEKSVKGKYTKEYLTNTIPSTQKVAGRLRVVGKYDCMNYWYTAHDWDEEQCYDELSYLIFRDESSAKKAFNTLKKNWIDSETDSGENFVQGWEPDVLDAEVEVFIYQTDNMIISAELQVVSSWAEPENGEDGNSTVGFYYRKDFIKDNF